uniref:Cytochrome c oxidase subunit 3 n=1 Tax=Haematopinus apri TaxID=1348091 RepID=R9ZRN3_9NEOP|nr:cytochrome c oxidase subunit III [Haematopinus apri]
MKGGFHPFHLVSPSPWPLLLSISTFSLMVGFYTWMSSMGSVLMMLGVFSVLLSLFCWLRDVIRESTYQGCHTMRVMKGLRLGIVMFIISEVMFFFSIFFGVFFLSLNPDVVLGSSYPPVGIQPLNYMGVPFLNTMILLSSGVTVTWCHHGIMSGNKHHSVVGLIITVMLGVLFVMFQFEEYYESSYTIADSVCGSLFYMSTGFHGIHVMLGTVMLIVSLVRLMMNHFSSTHNLGFEMSAWYWHFVDVVWLFLFISIYWWGSWDIILM